MIAALAIIWLATGLATACLFGACAAAGRGEVQGVPA